MSAQVKKGLESGARLFKKAFDAGFLFIPFTSLHPIRVYLSLATSLTICRDRSTIRKVLLLHAFLLVNFLKTIYLYVCLPPNPLDRVRLADFMYITTEENFSYRIWIPCQAMLLYFNYIIFTVKPIFLCYLEALLFNKDQPLLGGMYRNSRSPLKNPKQSVLWTLNAIGILKLLSDILYLIVCATILNEAIDHPADLLANPLVSPLVCIWRISQVIVGLIGLFLALFIYATVCPNVAAVACATINLILLRLQVNAKRLTAWKLSLRNHFTWTPFADYRAYSLKTFSLLFIANEVIGKTFAAFIRRARVRLLNPSRGFAMSSLEGAPTL